MAKFRSIPSILITRPMTFVGKLLFKKPANQTKLTEIQNENSSKLLDEIRKDLQKIIKSAD